MIALAELSLKNIFYSQEQIDHLRRFDCPF